jgi:plastocyanin
VRLRVLAGLATTALLGLVGCSSTSSASGGVPFRVSGTAVSTDRVDMPKSYKFSPAVIEVKVGTTVTWTNHDDFPHNVTLLTGSEKTSKDVGIGDSVSMPFAEAATYYYQCSFHPQQMRGKVIVTQ